MRLLISHRETGAWVRFPYSPPFNEVYMRLNNDVLCSVTVIFNKDILYVRNTFKLSNKYFIRLSTSSIDFSIRLMRKIPTVKHRKSLKSDYLRTSNILKDKYNTNLGITNMPKRALGKNQPFYYLSNKYYVFEI